MRHLCDVRDNDLARNILSDRKCYVGRELLKLLALQKIAERYRHGLLVRNLDTDCRLSRDRRLDTDVRRRKIQLDVIRKPDDLRHLDTLLRLQLVPRDAGTLADVRDRHLYTEGIQRLLQTHRRLLQLLCGVSRRCNSFLQPRQRWEHISLRNLFLRVGKLLLHLGHRRCRLRLRNGLLLRRFLDSLFMYPYRLAGHIRLRLLSLGCQVPDRFRLRLYLLRFLLYLRLFHIINRHLMHASDPNLVKVQHRRRHGFRLRLLLHHIRLRYLHIGFILRIHDLVDVVPVPVVLLRLHQRGIHHDTGHLSLHPEDLFIFLFLGAQSPLLFPSCPLLEPLLIPDLRILSPALCILP